MQHLTTEGPRVSILMVARDAASHIHDAIASARAQTFTDWELVLVDDGSRDDTLAIARGHAAQDPRIRIMAGPQAGLAAVRNASFAAARGRWAAILDSDDLLHPDHLARLVAAAEASGAEIVAANMIEFRDGADDEEARLFADGGIWAEEHEIGLADYIRSNALYAGGVSLGYLKPLFDAGFLRSHGVAYDARLRIGEDYDLVVRAMAAGARLRYLPMPTYLYRRHAASTSYRLTRRDLVALIDSAEAGATGAADVHAALAVRRDSLDAALAHNDVLDALKARAPLAALRALAAHRRAPALTWRSVVEGASRRLGLGSRGIPKHTRGATAADPARTLATVRLATAGHGR